MNGIKLIKFLHNRMTRNYIITKSITNLTNDAVREKRNIIFNEELARQQSLITRVEKIEVCIKSPPDPCTLIMNKDISTPFDCGKHIGEVITERAVLAQVNGELWDMHRPLTDNCELKFLYFKQEDPYFVNHAFWRSGSFLLGLLAERVFRNNFYVQGHSWTPPHVRSGSFICDVDLDMDEWNPTQEELNILTSTMMKICQENHRFERLEVDTGIALQIFKDNRYKKEQVPKIGSQNSNRITLYRVGDHIDISKGPMIANTSLVGRLTVAAVHRLDSKDGRIYRFQGVGLPKELPLNHVAYSILVKRAAKLVKNQFHQKIPHPA